MMSNTEIERKFLIDGEKLPKLGQAMLIRQGYLCFDPEIRIRIATSGNSSAFMTLKGAGTIERSEIEFAIPIRKAQALFAHIQAREILKNRYVWLGPDGRKWEIDIYSGSLSGLIVGEVELGHPTDSLQVPAFVLKEVTVDRSYKNASLARFGLPSEQS